jgi:hypothetical protein
MAVPPEIITAINNFLTLMTILGGVLLAFFLGLSGFYLLTSGGNPKGQEQGKAAAFNAVVGFGIIVLARAIASMVNSAIPH